MREATAWGSSSHRSAVRRRRFYFHIKQRTFFLNIWISRKNLKNRTVLNTQWGAVRQNPNISPSTSVWTAACTTAIPSTHSHALSPSLDAPIPSGSSSDKLKSIEESVVNKGKEILVALKDYKGCEAAIRKVWTFLFFFFSFFPSFLSFLFVYSILSFAFILIIFVHSFLFFIYISFFFILSSFIPSNYFSFERNHDRLGYHKSNSRNRAWSVGPTITCGWCLARVFRFFEESRRLSSHTLRAAVFRHTDWDDYR